MGLNILRHNLLRSSESISEYVQDPTLLHNFETGKQGSQFQGDAMVIDPRLWVY